jgi:serine/threonine-protein kinase
LPDFREGKYQPQDNDERLGLVGVCQSQGRCHAAARLFADAFAADPHLAEHLISQCRSRAARANRQHVDRFLELTTQCLYPAARCAAVAGCGLGADGAKLGEAERSHWRRQAREWLRADLAVWARTPEGGSQAARVLGRRLLTRWQVDPDLAGLRDPSALARLSSDERKECLALWKEVAAVLARMKKASGAT